jgi:hypothetical protein
VNKPLTALIVSAGIALIITAATLPGRQTSSVVDSLSTGGGTLERASLGESGS